MAQQAVGAAAWSALAPVTAGATLFLDKASADSLAWSLGADAAFQHPLCAVQVRQIQRSSSDNPRDLWTRLPTSRAVFVVSSLLPDWQDTLAEALLALQDAGCSSAHVASTFTAAAHAYYLSTVARSSDADEYDADELFTMFQEQLAAPLTTLDLTVGHVPACFTLLDPALFFLPSAARFIPPLPSRLPRTPNGAIALPRMAKPLRVALLRLACAIASALPQLGVAAELFACGSIAGLLARAVASVLKAAPYPASARTPASLVILDRSVDVAAAVSHSSNLLHRILDLLPARSACDVHVNVDPVYLPARQAGSCLRGSLAHPDAPLWRTLLLQRRKDVLLAMRAELRALAAGSGQGNKVAARMGMMTAAELAAWLAVVASLPAEVAAQHVGTIDLACALLQAMQTAPGRLYDELASQERIMQLSVAEDPASVPRQLADMLQHEPRVHSLRDLVKVTTFAYAIAPASGFDDDDQALLRSAFARVLMQQPECVLSADDDLFWIAERPLCEEILMLRQQLAQGDQESAAADTHHALGVCVEAALDDLFVCLKDISSCSASARATAHATDGASECVLRDIVARILANDPADAMADILHVPHSLGSMVRSGFTSLGLSSRPRPAATSELIVFVVGGVTASEVAAMLAAVPADSPVRLRIGSTGWARSDMVLEALFAVVS